MAATKELSDRPAEELAQLVAGLQATVARQSALLDGKQRRIEDLERRRGSDAVARGEKQGGRR